VLETGIKIIDLLFPMVKGSKSGIRGGAALGKSILTLEIIHNIVKKHSGSCVFVGAGVLVGRGVGVAPRPWKALQLIVRRTPMSNTQRGSKGFLGFIVTLLISGKELV